MGTDIVLASIIYNVIINILKCDTIQFYEGVFIVDTIISKEQITKFRQAQKNWVGQTGNLLHYNAEL